MRWIGPHWTTPYHSTVGKVTAGGIVCAGWKPVADCYLQQRLSAASDMGMEMEMAMEPACYYLYVRPSVVHQTRCTAVDNNGLCFLGREIVWRLCQSDCPMSMRTGKSNIIAMPHATRAVPSPRRGWAQWKPQAGF